MIAEDYITGDMKERILLLNGGDQEAADSACSLLNDMVRSFRCDTRQVALDEIIGYAEAQAALSDASPR